MEGSEDMGFFKKTNDAVADAQLAIDQYKQRNGKDAKLPKKYRQDLNTALAAHQESKDVSAGRRAARSDKKVKKTHNKLDNKGGGKQPPKSGGKRG